MKNILLSFIVVIGLVGCDTLQQVAGEVLTTDSPAGLTNTEVISGLKSALQVGINNASGLASKTDGFNANSLIRLPFPPEAIKVKETLEKKGLLAGQIANFETTLNRAAEEASKEAAPIFLNAIKNMSIADGFTILKGADNAATNFLKEKTTAQLVTAFSPKAKSAMDKVELTKLWKPLVTAYNTATIFSGKEEINANLEEYVTNRAIGGLFTLLSSEEGKIRKDPGARVNDILKKVFGSLDPK